MLFRTLKVCQSVIQPDIVTNKVCDRLGCMNYLICMHACEHFSHHGDSGRWSSLCSASCLGMWGCVGSLKIPTERERLSRSANGPRVNEAWGIMQSGIVEMTSMCAVQVFFEKPELCVAGLSLRSGPESSVVLKTSYLDEAVRLGKGSRGSSFVFVRGGEAETAGDVS